MSTPASSPLGWHDELNDGIGRGSELHVRLIDRAVRLIREAAPALRDDCLVGFVATRDPADLAVGEFRYPLSPDAELVVDVTPSGEAEADLAHQLDMVCDKAGCDTCSSTGGDR